VADIRDCEHCGAKFAPRREHARFCSARCRVAWNRENMRDPAAGASALNWSVTAMRDATQRLARVKGVSRPRAFAVIGEAVWWVTIVDGTLVRHHPAAYDRVLAAQAPGERRLIEGALGGLRFVRNQMGRDVDHVDFIRPAAPALGDGRITAWTWNSVQEPTVEPFSARGQAWEMTRYQAYEEYLAGYPIGTTFERATAFLDRAATQTILLAEAAERATR
jgi:hypothetical protein